MNNGIFIISLDFELHWGIFEKVALKERLTYLENTLTVIPKILDLFTQYDIEASWATVGMLFNKQLSELMLTFPSTLPNYREDKLSAYTYIQKNKKLIESHPNFYFAKNLIELIDITKGQEIASHTYSHYYCLEEGQDNTDFKKDLDLNISKAKNNSVDIKSIIFPRNQYNKAYNSVLLELGIKTLRSNPKVWFWDTTTKETLLKKIVRTADCYIPLYHTLYDLKKQSTQETQILEIPASRFFRPMSGVNFLNKLRIRRIKNEMTRAAKYNKYYHLWWHPHNFGTNPEAALSELEELLIHFKYLSKKYDMKSLNMNSVYKRLIDNDIT